jgi:hypothetical protein
MAETLKQLNREAKDLLTNIRRFPEFCERCLKIIPIEGGVLLPFKLNAIQLWFFWKYVVPAWEAGDPVRVIILKCRQTGMSTLISAFTLWCTLGSRNWNSALIAKNDEQVKVVFEMTQRFHRNLPMGDNNLLPNFVVSRNNTSIIEFNMPEAHSITKHLVNMRRKVFLDSRVRIMSGEKKSELGRGGTFQTVHGSEAAFWTDLNNALSALFASCHPRSKTAIFLETTANGYNEFHTLWVNRSIGKKDIPTYWQTCFIPWYWDDRYELENVDSPRKFLDEYEEMLYRIIITDTTIEEIGEDRAWMKLFWRRMAIEDRQGNVELFSQEYPATASEAFMSTGRPAFPRVHLKRMELQIRDPERKCRIELEENGAPKLTDSDEGRLKIFLEPEQDEKYVVGVDIAEGKAAEGTLSDEQKSRFDYSVVNVFQMTPFPPAKQAAIWHGSIDPDQLADVMVAICRYYNKAFLAWEVNGPGGGLNYHVVQRLRYNNLYYREDWDQGGQRVRATVGWRTTGYTKPNMVYIGKEFIREQAVEIYDVGTLNEFKAFSDMGSGKYSAVAGHDDRVIAALIALAVSQPRIEMFKRQKEAALKKRDEKKRLSEDPVYARKKKKGYNPILGNEF